MNDLECAQWNCVEPHHEKGLCEAHYQAQYEERQKKCRVDGCGRKVNCRGLCQTHYRRLRKGEELDRPIRPRGVEGCVVEGCEGKHYAYGCCVKHYRSPNQKVTDNAYMRYGIAPEVREELDLFEGACSLCGVVPEKGLVIDHDHAHCGGRHKGCPQCVRGLICHRCNNGLHYLENVTWRARAMAYLESPPAYAVIARREVEPAPPPGVPFEAERELIAALKSADSPGTLEVDDARLAALCVAPGCRTRPKGEFPTCSKHRSSRCEVCGEATFGLKVCDGCTPQPGAKAEPKVCEAEGCGRNAPSGIYCSTHYRWRREGEPRVYGRTTCENCSGRHYARGLCRRCYRRKKNPPRVDA